jgi:hypothetical protein
MKSIHRERLKKHDRDFSAHPAKMEPIDIDREFGNRCNPDRYSPVTITSKEINISENSYLQSMH